jgi:SAM-dependent methyltransferase
LFRSARGVSRALRSRSGELRVGAPLQDGSVDGVSLHLDGTIAAFGWSKDLDNFRSSLALTIGGVTSTPTHAYRVRRADLAVTLCSHAVYYGAAAEWVTAPRTNEEPAILLADGRVIASFAAPSVDEPPYAHLRNEARVLKREDIYAFGPPVPEVSIEVLELARQLPPPVLDFGCGAGALVRALRKDGIEAYGLELDTERIRHHLLDEARPWVTLYDGRLPSPFRQGEFRSVACSEVIEHIPHPEAVLAELARLASDRLFVTVPDMSAIPRGYHHGVVPWHLLESTHVNFFTQASLEALLAPMASRTEIARIGQVICDRMSYFTSLAAIGQR